LKTDYRPTCGDLPDAILQVGQSFYQMFKTGRSDTIASLNLGYHLTQCWSLPTGIVLGVLKHLAGGDTGAEI
jgi:hypothetical protein